MGRRTKEVKETAQKAIQEKAEVGRPELVFTRSDEETVRFMCVLGHNQEQIAKHLGICRLTLQKNFREILDTAKVDKNINVADSLYYQAVMGNVQAQIFWLKTQAGFKETQVHEFNPPQMMAFRGSAEYDEYKKFKEVQGEVIENE